MAESPSFSALIERLRSGEGDAAARVHQRFVRRLVGLACRQFESRVRSKADHEGIVQSAFKSFFARCQRGEFELSGWDAVWALLVRITIHKCAHQRERLGAIRRDVHRECSWDRELPPEHPAVLDRAPTPAEAAALRETVALWLRDLEPVERGIVELGLEGYEDHQIAMRLHRSERTVRRIRRRVEDRLLAHCSDEPR
jgi:RNA polymerase sigma-70 factor (ECF subfamily)